MMGIRRWGLGLVVGLALGMAALPRPAGAATIVMAEAQPPSSDAAITAAIKSKLDGNKVVANAQVTIATLNGVVTLVGTVPNDFARDQILEATRSTPGVAKVDDHLRLEISSPQAPTRN
jgi:hyperosmotically inducible periplasmic protein